MTPLRWQALELLVALLCITAGVYLRWGLALACIVVGVGLPVTSWLLDRRR